MSSRWRWMPWGIGFLALSLLAAACVAASTASTGAVGKASSVSVTLKEFSITPGTVSVAAGASVAVQVTNAGGAQHALAVDVGGRTYQTGLLGAGGSATLSLPTLSAGTYSMWCPIPGHKEAGMTALLSVGNAPAGSTDGSSDAGMGSMDMSTMTAQQMADAHKASTEAFPQPTEGQGNSVLKPTVEGGVKVFHVVAQEVRWEVSAGVFQTAFAYNGTVPGPEIQAKRGDRVRIVLENQLRQPTTIHFHGLTVPNAMDGVPYITQDPVMPGGYFVYEFTVVDAPGTYVYHSHFNSTEQVGRGLYGAFIVEPTKKAWDDEYTLFLGDGPLGYVLNGKSFPATQPLAAKLGETVLIRIANDGQLLHPMHLHGYHFEVIAQDGAALASPYKADTLVIAPGQRFDVLVHAVYPGAWAFHCHILSHVEGPSGMYGMVTALVVAGKA